MVTKYNKTHSFVTFAPLGEWWRIVAPPGATKKGVKMCCNVSQSGANKIKLLRHHILLKNKKNCATYRHISPHFVTFHHCGN